MGAIQNPAIESGFLCPAYRNNHLAVSVPSAMWRAPITETLTECNGRAGYVRVSGDSTPTHPLVCCGTSFRLYGDGFFLFQRVITNLN